MDDRIRNHMAALHVPIYDALEDRYTPGKIIGKGSFGQVYLGTPTKTTAIHIPELGKARSVVCIEQFLFNLFLHPILTPLLYLI